MTDTDETPTPPAAWAEFDVQSRWKEEVIYWEGGVGFSFDAGWGIDPPVLYVPPASEWDQVVPDWMAGRREVIIARLAERSGHRLEVGPYPSDQRGRWVTR